jgi:hypothetical protein
VFQVRYRSRALATRRSTRARQSKPLDAIADLIGSVDGLPADLSARKKRYLKAQGIARNVLA